MQRGTASPSNSPRLRIEGGVGELLSQVGQPTTLSDKIRYVNHILWGC